MGAVPEISPEGLKQLLDGPAEHRPVLLDVRTPGEYALVALPGAVLIPLHELPEHEDELEDHRGKAIVAYCHHGVRSLSATAFLRERGFDARSLAGGIERYAQQVDPSLPRY